MENGLHVLHTLTSLNTLGPMVIQIHETLAFQSAESLKRTVNFQFTRIATRPQSELV